MSSWDRPATTTEQPVRRVRQHVRDGLAVVVTSLVASTALAVALTVLTKLAG